MCNEAIETLQVHKSGLKTDEFYMPDMTENQSVPQKSALKLKLGPPLKPNV